MFSINDTKGCDAAMCTTLDIAPKLIEAAVRITCEASKSEATVKAVGEYLKSVQIPSLQAFPEILL